MHDPDRLHCLQKITGAQAWNPAQGGIDLSKSVSLLCGLAGFRFFLRKGGKPGLTLDERALFTSDGQPTDDYKKSLDKLLHLPWGKKAVRIAISIGQDADDDVLEQFTGNRELVLQANNPQALVKMNTSTRMTASAHSAIPISFISSGERPPPRRTT